MPTVFETDDSLFVQNKMSVASRVGVLLLALFPLLAPYQLVYLPNWTDYLNPFFFLCVLISIGATVVSGLFVWAALAHSTASCRGRPRNPWATSHEP
jgi:hypothetical protein